MRSRYRAVFPGVLIALGLLCAGFCMTACFELFHGFSQDSLHQEAQENISRSGLSASAETLGNTAMVFLLRARDRAEGLGAGLLIVCLLMGATNMRGFYKLVLSTSLGVGSFLYVFSWFLAGTLVPSRGEVVARELVHASSLIGLGLGMAALVGLIMLLVLQWLKSDAAMTYVFFHHEHKHGH